MPVPRKVARSLRQSAARIEKIPSAAVADAATYAVEAGAGAGGRFASGPLTVAVRKVTSRRGTSTANVGGKSAGAWSIKSHGRSGGTVIRVRRDRRRQALGLRGAGLARSAYSTVTMGPAAGDDRFRKYVGDPTRDEFGEIVDEQVTEALK